MHAEAQIKLPGLPTSDPSEKSVTNIGFIALLLGVLLGLDKYCLTIVLAGFVLLLAGILLYPVGKLTEKNFPSSDDEAGMTK